MNTRQGNPNGHWRHSYLCLLWLLLATLMLNGCARLRLPRIDPSGNSIFLRGPNSTQFLLPGSTTNPAPGLPGAVVDSPSLGAFQPLPAGAIAAAPQIPGQMVAPTAISPVQPATTGNQTQPAFQAPPTPPPCNTPLVEKKKYLVPDPNRLMTQGQSGQLIMTPSKIIAPVGSEVVVLAGICGSDGRFIKNQPIQWQMGNSSVGNFIEVGGTQHSAFNRLVPPTATKINGQYAEGRTGLKRIVLSRGTPTTLDDIELREGQTFVSVASAAPGTSYITGVANRAEGWDRRRAITVIHWVDANWSIPVPQQATAGTVTPLTTVVSRTDGSGVNDWNVRYSIVGGAPAEFEPSGSQTSEAKTDRDGQATVQIRQPTGKFEPGTTQIRVDVIRPPVFGQPELIVESGITSVTWSAPALTIRAIGPRTTEQNTPFNYRVEVTNPGDQVARGVKVRTRDLDDSIEYISSTPKPSTELGRQLEWDLGDIAPNATAQVIEIQVQPRRLGNVGLCFEVLSETDQLQTEACAQTEVIEPCLNLILQAPNTALVGSDVDFQIRVENRCDQALQNVSMQIRHDPGLIRPGRSNPTTINLDNGGLLQVGDSADFTFTATAQSTGENCVEVIVTANGVRPERKTVCVNLEPLVGGQSPPVRTESSNLRIEPRAEAAFEAADDRGQPVVLTPVTIRVVNQGNVVVEDARLELRLPPSLELWAITDSVSLAGSDDIFLATLPRLGPGQSVDVKTQLRSLRNDPAATLNLSVSSTLVGNAGAVEAIRVPATLPGGVPSDEPDLMEPPISIPDSVDDDSGTGLGAGQPAAAAPLAGRGPIIVEVTPVQTRLRVNEKQVFEFRVTNNSGQALRDVTISMLIPNTLQFGESEAYYNSDALAIQNGDQLTRINTFPPGASNLTQIELRAGNLPGAATFEVQVKSADTAGEFTDQSIIQIVN